MKKVVLDTNVLLVSISERSRLHWVFQKLLAGEFSLCVTTEILAEYAEIVERHMGHATAEAVMATLENLPNLQRVNTFFKFHLLKDEDDNKFVDCAIAANADCIVSHDRDFLVLSNIEFPKVEVLNTENFQVWFAY